jgi:hypothetical protein
MKKVRLALDKGMRGFTTKLANNLLNFRTDISKGTMIG